MRRAGDFDLLELRTIVVFRHGSTQPLGVICPAPSGKAMRRVSVYGPDGLRDIGTFEGHERALEALSQARWETETCTSTSADGSSETSHGSPS